MRLPKQMLIIPYTKEDDKVLYCIFKRKDLGFYQFISGGCEDFDKDTEDSAKRELFEETGIKDISLEKLEIETMIPVVNIRKDFFWGKDVFYAKEYVYAVNITGKDIILSDEHSEYKFGSYEEIKKHLKYDSNKSALWELNEKLIR